MSFPFFRLCTFLTLLPLVLSTLNRAPEALQSTPISLRWMGQSDPSDCLGAFLTHTLKGSVKVATKDGTVDNFTVDQIVDITFNYTSPSGKDCNLVAWLQELCHCFAKTEQIAVPPDHKETASKSTFSDSVFPSKSTSAVTTAPSGQGATPTLSVVMDMPSLESISSSRASGTAAPEQSTTKAIPTEAIVGIVIGSFALLLSLVFALLVWRRRSRQKAIESAPSRAFWRSLGMKSPPLS
ncbi:hypothetical protein ARMSODRAFT_978995 [Armillaria solidipes]|uniref:Mid2 domain-containing protein n=1 Tax=Armillaria solidipes TaxID=1076256 RepID=A0A2H3B6E3_9AGAR|nr:hypothetical protein ARMSODRAFT_978995 [Armillaria solidipes]